MVEYEQSSNWFEDDFLHYPHFFFGYTILFFFGFEQLDASDMK